MGSVKSLEVIQQPTETELGIGRFNFSDDYSVFDWGTMPDVIPHKGEALCMMSSYNFKELPWYMITHYRGLVCDGNLVDFSDEPTNVMEFYLTRQIKPTTIKNPDNSLIYDYSVFSSGLNNFFIPLEIIFRNGLPASSSVFKRLKKGEIAPEDIGLDHYPVPGEELKEPIIDFSTKMENGDRYLKRSEAQTISGLSKNHFEILIEEALLIDTIISLRAEEVGLKHEDGKVEAFFYNNRIWWADAIGTFDENKFTYSNLPVSKEVLREPYRRLQSDWIEEVDWAKNEARNKGIKNFKTLCKLKPKKLDSEAIKIASEIYMSGANLYIGKHIFDSPPLAEVVKDYQNYIQNIS